MEELDAFLGDAHSVGHQKRLSAMGSSSKRGKHNNINKIKNNLSSAFCDVCGAGTILRADSGTGDSLSRKSPMEQSLPRDGGKSSSLDDKPLKNEANLTQLASLLPSSGFVSSTAVNLMSSVNEEVQFIMAAVILRHCW